MGNWVEKKNERPINLDVVFSFYRETQSIKNDVIVERYFIIFDNDHGDVIKKWNFWGDEKERDKAYAGLKEKAEVAPFQLCWRIKAQPLKK